MCEQDSSRYKLKVKFDLIPETLETPWKEDFAVFEEGFVRGDPGGFVLTPPYAQRAEDIYNLKPRPDDVWIVTFPKCGTTWTQDMVWLLTHDCDYEGAKENIDSRSPFVEFTYLLGHKFRPPELDESCGENPDLKIFYTLEEIDQLPSPRVLKSHLPLYLLPPKLLDTSKVIYVARNPKDVIVSYFHHHRLFSIGFPKDVEAFAEYFLNDLTLHTPFFPHLLEAWNLRHHPNLLFLFFEDMKKDLRGEIQKVANFLGKTPSEDQLTRLTDHLTFANFAKNEAVNRDCMKKLGLIAKDRHFIRKGKTGDWKNHFSPEMNERIDRWIQSNLAGSDLTFVTEIDE